MNRDANVGEDFAKNAADSPTVGAAEWGVTPKRKWSRPTVAIIDLKRTMFSGGSIFDGIALSSDI